MLALNDPLWHDLRHAYGAAGDIPALLGKLASGSPDRASIWFDLWSALAHQGDVYPASFAAVPHIVELIAMKPHGATYDEFGFVAWVEICRVRKGLAVEPRLTEAYSRALARIPELMTRVPPESWTEDFSIAAFAAVAVSRGLPALGESLMEFRGLLPDFKAWLESQ